MVSWRRFGNANSLPARWRQDAAFGTLPFFVHQRESTHE